MKKITLGAILLLSWVAISSLVACNNNGGGGAPPPPPPAQPPIAPCTYGSCPNGWGAAGSSVNFYAQKDAQVYGGLTGYQNPTRLSVLSPFKDVLRNIMGVCDRMDNTGGIYSCDAWQSGAHQIIISTKTTTDNQATLSIKSYPTSSNQFSYYGYQFPDAREFFLNLIGLPTAQVVQGMYNPLILNSTIWPKGNGFELRIESPPAYSKGGSIQIITDGKLEDASFNFDLFYQGKKAASGTMFKY
jgi:hypothetical protein